MKEALDIQLENRKRWDRTLRLLGVTIYQVSACLHMCKTCCFVLSIIAFILCFIQSNVIKKHVKSIVDKMEAFLMS